MRHYVGFWQIGSHLRKQTAMRHSKQMVTLHCNFGQNATSEHPIFKFFLSMLHMLIVPCTMLPGQYQLHT